MNETPSTISKNMPSEIIYDKIVEYVNGKGKGFKILKFYLEFNLISKFTSQNILINIFKSKDFCDKYHNLNRMAHFLNSAIRMMDELNQYDSAFEETNRYSSEFIIPQINYSYIIYLLNEIAKHDKYYYIAFYKLSKKNEFDPNIIMNNNKSDLSIIKSDAKRSLYLSYSSSPELLSWRVWMKIYDGNPHNTCYNKYCICDQIYYILRLFSIDFPIIFEGVDINLVNEYSKEIFGLEPLEISSSSISFADYFEMIQKSYQNLPQENLLRIKNLCFEFEITKLPNTRIFYDHWQSNIELYKIIIQVYNNSSGFMNFHTSNGYCFYILYNLTKYAETERELSNENIDYMVKLFTWALNFKIDSECGKFFISSLKSVVKNDYGLFYCIQPFINYWISLYEKNDKQNYEIFHDAMTVLLKVVKRSQTIDMHLVAKEIRESERSNIFGLNYEEFLSKDFNYLKNELNNNILTKSFEQLSTLHASKLWKESIAFLKEYVNDKRMTIKIIEEFLEKNKSEIYMAKTINLLEYLEKNNSTSDQKFMPYLEIQRKRIQFSYFYYLINESKKFNIESIYLISKQISIDERIFMKKIFSRKFHILDEILFEKAITYLYDEYQIQQCNEISFKDPFTELGIEEFNFCQEILNQYPLEINIIYPVMDPKYSKDAIKLLDQSKCMFNNTIYEKPYNFYDLFKPIYHIIKDFKPNQSFRNIFNIPQEKNSGNKLNYLISLYVSTYKCIKGPLKMKEDTRNFIIKKLSENCLKKDVLIDILTENGNTTDDHDYLIFKQILNEQEDQCESFSRFYRIIEIYNLHTINPSEPINFEILRSFNFSKYWKIAKNYISFQSKVISKVINKTEYLSTMVIGQIKNKVNNYQVIKFFIDKKLINLDKMSVNTLKLIMNVSEQEELKERIKPGIVEIKPVESDLDISWVLDLVKYSEKVKFIYSLRTYDFVNIYKSLQKEDKREIEMTKEFLKTGNSKVLDSYENEISEEFFDTFVSHPEFFNTNNLIRSINNLSLPFKSLNEKSIDILNMLIQNYENDLTIIIPVSNFLYFFNYCQKIFPFLKEINGIWNYQPSKYQSISGFINDITKMVDANKIVEDLTQLKEFCDLIDSKVEELYIQDFNHIINENSGLDIHLPSGHNVTVGIIILRLLQNSNSFECNMKIFSNYFKERNEEQKLKIENQSNLSEFYFNLQKEIESKEKIHKTKISFINDFNDDLPEKMTKERFNLFEKLLFVDKNKWKLIENSFLSVFTFCEENHLFRYQEHIIAYTLKCIEENNNIFFTNPLKELYKFILNSIINETQDESSEFCIMIESKRKNISKMILCIKKEVINTLKAEFEKLKKKKIKDTLEKYSNCFHKIIKNVPILMIKSISNNDDFLFDKIKFFDMILSYSQMNIDFSTEDVDEFHFLFKEKRYLTVRNSKTDRVYTYSYCNSPHLLVVCNSIGQSLYKCDDSNITWADVKVLKRNQTFTDCTFEMFCELHSKLEHLVKKETIETQIIFGLNYCQFLNLLAKISEGSVESFSQNFQNFIDTIVFDSSYPETIRVIEKYIEMSKISTLPKQFYILSKID